MSEQDKPANDRFQEWTEHPRPEPAVAPKRQPRAYHIGRAEGGWNCIFDGEEGFFVPGRPGRNVRSRVATRDQDETYVSFLALASALVRLPGRHPLVQRQVLVRREVVHRSHAPDRVRAVARGRGPVLVDTMTRSELDPKPEHAPVLVCLDDLDRDG